MSEALLGMSLQSGGEERATGPGLQGFLPTCQESLFPSLIW